MTEKTRSDSVSTTTGRSTSCNKLSILDILKKKLLNVIETTLVNSLSKELARWLSAIRF